MISDNLSSHSCRATRASLAAHPRLEQAFIPEGACWLNLREAWWQIFRRHALAGQTFADRAEIAQVTDVATARLDAHGKPCPLLPARDAGAGPRACCDRASAQVRGVTRSSRSASLPLSVTT